MTFRVGRARSWGNWDADQGKFYDSSSQHCCLLKPGAGSSTRGSRSSHGSHSQDLDIFRLNVRICGAEVTGWAGLGRNQRKIINLANKERRVTVLVRVTCEELNNKWLGHDICEESIQTNSLDDLQMIETHSHDNVSTRVWWWCTCPGVALIYTCRN